MFGSIRTLLGESRGKVLWQEILNLTQHMAALSEPHAERFGHTCASLVNQWVGQFSPVEKSDASLRRTAVKEFKNTAKQRYDTDRGVSFGYALFSINLEASSLAGEDAKRVYELSSQALGMAVAKVAAENTAKAADVGRARRFGVWCAFDDGGRQRESWYIEHGAEVAVYATQEEAEVTAKALRFTVGLSDVAASFRYSVREIPEAQAITR
jgi:hypothetical protein